MPGQNLRLVQKSAPGLYGTHSNFVFIHYSCNTLGHVRGKILIYQSDKFCEAVSVNGKPIYVVLRMVLCGLVCAL